MRNEAKRGPAITKGSIIINQGERRLRTTRKQNYAAILRTLRPIYTEEFLGVAAHDSLFVLLRRVILRSCTATPGRNKTNKESCAATPGNFSV